MIYRATTILNFMHRPGIEPKWNDHRTTAMEYSVFSEVILSYSLSNQPGKCLFCFGILPSLVIAVLKEYVYA